MIEAYKKWADQTTATKIFADAFAELISTLNSQLQMEALINAYPAIVDVHFPQEEGMTLLMLAAKEKALEAVKLLILNGAKETVKDNNGHTAFDYYNWAVQQHHAHHKGVADEEAERVIRGLLNSTLQSL